MLLQSSANKSHCTHTHTPRSTCFRYRYKRLRSLKPTHISTTTPLQIQLTSVQTLPKASSASMSGHISPTPPTARWSWSSDDDDDTDNYRAMVDDCTDAIVRRVRCVMNTCCRSRVDKEVRGWLAYCCKKPWSLRF